MANPLITHAGAAIVSLCVGSSIGYYISQNEGQATRQDVTAQIAQVERDSVVLPIAGSPMRGAANAKATVVIFTDFKAPATYGLYHDILDKLFKVHGDNVAVVYKAYPLSQHPDAMVRAQAAAAAQLQGKFWQMADALAINSDVQFEKGNALALAQKLGLDLAKFDKDFDTPEVREMIRRDIAAGEKLKIKGAPSVFVNGNTVVFPDGINETALMEAVNAEVMRMNSLTSRPGGNYLIASLLNQQIQAGAMASDALGRPVRGAKDALVTIVEYSDYECPFCSRVEPTLAKLLQEYDNVRVVFSHHPLPFHKNAKLASQAAYAAGLQGKFWEMHDTLFKHQKQLGEVNLIGYAEELGLDMDQFKADLHAPSTVAAIDANLAEADTHRISGTPNFLINGVAFTGARPYEQFKKAVDEAIAKAEPIRAKTGLTGDALYAEIMKSGTNAEQDNVAKMPMDHMQRIERAGKFLAEAEKANAEKPMAVSQGVSYAKGPDDAKVVIYMFSEFQCPFCSRVEPTIAELEKEYAGKIKIVFKNFPLAFHRDAKLASEAALAAGEQGKFWEMHDLLFQNQKNLGREALTGYAKQLGLDVAQFDAALDSHKFASQVDLELKEGQDNGITGTPSFFINGKKLVGAQPLEKFKAEIDAALQ